MVYKGIKGNEGLQIVAKVIVEKKGHYTLCNNYEFNEKLKLEHQSMTSWVKYRLWLVSSTCCDIVGQSLTSLH